MEEVPSFIGAPRWPLEAAKLRLTLRDRAAVRLPDPVIGPITDTIVRSPRGSRLRRAALSRRVLAGWAAYDAGDWDFLERIYERDVIFDFRFEGLDDLVGLHEGFPAMRKVLAEYGSVLEGQETTLADMLDLGGRHAAVHNRLGGTARHSGLPLKFDVLHMYELGPDGMVRRQWALNADEHAAEQVLAEHLAESGS